MKVYKGKKSFDIKIKEAGFFGKIFGLMFCSRETESLLFKFSKSTKIAIHSYFVFFYFLVIWLNNKNKIIEYKIVKPFSLTVKPMRKFYKLVEMPMNEKNEKLIKQICTC